MSNKNKFCSKTQIRDNIEPWMC